jgi:hypothetical protein
MGQSPIAHHVVPDLYHHGSAFGQEGKTALIALIKLGIPGAAELPERGDLRDDIGPRASHSVI